MLSDIQSAVDKVEGSVHGVTSVCAKIEQQLKAIPAPSSDDTRVLKTLEGIRDILDSDLDDIKLKLSGLPGDNDQVCLLVAQDLADSWPRSRRFLATSKRTATHVRFYCNNKRTARGI